MLVSHTCDTHCKSTHGLSYSFLACLLLPLLPRTTLAGSFQADYNNMVADRDAYADGSGPYSNMQGSAGALQPALPPLSDAAGAAAAQIDGMPLAAASADANAVASANLLGAQAAYQAGCAAALGALPPLTDSGQYGVALTGMEDTVAALGTPASSVRWGQAWLGVFLDCAGAVGATGACRCVH